LAAERRGDCGKATRDRTAIGALRQAKSLNSRSNSLRLELRRRNSTEEIPMAFFVVNCDLRRKDEFDYQELWDEFERLGAVKYQKFDYFLSVSNTADEIRDYFKRFVHDDDSLMVIEFEKKPKFTKSVKGTNAWIDKHWA
jgi:hypothetical protein